METCILEYSNGISANKETILFCSVLSQFLIDKNLTFEYVKSLSLDQFVTILCVEKEIGLYLHNENGPAYGTIYRKANTPDKYPHVEYWLNGKRILEKEEWQKQTQELKEKG